MPELGANLAHCTVEEARLARHGDASRLAGRRSRQIKHVASGIYQLPEPEYPLPPDVELFVRNRTNLRPQSLCLLSVSTSVPAKAEAMADRLAQVSGHVTNAYGRGLLAGEVAIITGEYILNPRLAALWAGWRCRALYTTIVACIKPYTRYIS